MKTKAQEKLLDILQAELIPALGCTEPIAIALAAASAREVLGAFPDRIEIYASSNIIKNVKSVVVPSTGGQKGIEAAATLGVIVGKATGGLEIFSNVLEEQRKKLNDLLRTQFCKTYHLKSGCNLHIIAKAYQGDNCGEAEIRNSHDKVVRTAKNGVRQSGLAEGAEEVPIDSFTLSELYDFATTVKWNEIDAVISRQIACNLAICEEGLSRSYGKNVGKTILLDFHNDVNNRARAYAAAGSDARMNGCALPVIINSGSGNQGITASVPICIFAKETDVDREKTVRAVCLSNLVAIYLKRGIGKLSAYCGAVSASCGVAAGLTYLKGGSFSQIAKAITNTVAGVSGIVCDGAKSSCAVKIASSVDAAIMAHYMALADRAFDGGDGIIACDIENMIENVMRLGKQGMRETDAEIIDIMLHNQINTEKETN